MSEQARAASFVWYGGHFEPAQPHPGPFDVVDSWRHSRGRTNGLAAHIARFESTAGPLPGGFVEEMRAVLEGFGGEAELFPRIARAQGLLLLDARLAPPARPTTALTLPVAEDPRTQPLVKGPDFERFAAYRARHQLPGTDDTIIVDAGGAAVETTTGALVGWDGDTLVVPAGLRLPSVTLAQVVGRARGLGVGVVKRKLLWEQPLWFLNSLHGISPVRAVVTPTHTVHPPAHPDAAEWQAWWWAGF